MNCSNVAELLERMIFEEVPLDDGLKQHIASCPSCGREYRDAMKSREILTVIRNSAPVPENPEEITDNIISAIQHEPVKKAVVPLVLQRFLVAASIALFILFGYEQYGVVIKISALEKELSETRTESRYNDPQHLVMTCDISRAGISLSGIWRLISGEQETRLRSVSLFKVK
jgi:hypothetical protein